MHRVSTTIALFVLLAPACERSTPPKAPAEPSDSGGPAGPVDGSTGADGAGSADGDEGSDGATPDTGGEPDTAAPSPWVCADGCDPGSAALGDCDRDGITNGDEIGLTDDPDAPWADPCLPDTDADGLDDCRELIWGTLPFDEDSDDDGHDDEWAVIESLLQGEGERPTVSTDRPSPFMPDSDGDGIPDLAEGCVGTNPRSADSDADGLADGPDLWRGCEPLHADTDGDGWQDGAEASAGASCREAADVPGFHSVFECEPGIQRGSYFPTASYYPSRGYSYGLGNACRCSVAIPEGGLSAAIGGISLYHPIAALGATTWADNPFPLAVLASAPSGLHYLSEGRVSADAVVDNVVGGEPVWMAFGDPAIEDSVSAEANLAGTWTLTVSLIQSAPVTDLDGETALRWISDTDHTCGPLTSSGGSVPIRFRFDPPPTAALAAPALPPADPSACRPGERGTTRFALVDAGPRPRLVRTGGSERYAGARPTRARVADWRGAEALEARLPGAAATPLTADGWAPLPAEATLPDLRWGAHRATAGTWRSPVVEVEHLCSSPPPASPRTRYRLRWAEADAASRAVAGVGVAGALGAEPGTATPLHVSVWPAADGSPALLQVISPGVGALLSLPLAPDGPGAWRVAGGLPAGLHLDTRVVEAPAALRLEVRGGRWTSPLGELPLGPATLHLPRVGG